MFDIRVTFSKLVCNMSFGVYRPQMGVASGMRVLCSDQSLQAWSPSCARLCCACGLDRVALKDQRRLAESNKHHQAG